MRQWLDRLLVVGIALAAYLAMARAECRGDGAQYFYNYLLGYQDGGRHYLVYIALGWADGLAKLLGTSLHDGAVGVCAAATAVGLGFVHAGWCRLGSARLSALLYTLAVGACPGVALYATVYELHGLFFAFAGLAFYGVALYAQRPSTRTAVVLGVLAGLSYLAHATGALLVGVMPWLGAAMVADSAGGGWSSMRRELPRAALASAVGVATMVVSLVGVSLLGSTTSLDSAVGFAQEWMAGDAEGVERPPADLLRTVWFEWLLPFLPASVLWLAAVRDRGARCLVLAFAVCVAGYLAMSMAMLRGLVEYGAYVLPLAAPAVWLVRRALPQPAVALLLVVAGVGTLHWGIPRTRSAEMARVGSAVAALADQRTVFLVGSAEDLEPFLLHAPDAIWGTLQLITHLRDAERARVVADGFVAGTVERIEVGVRVLLTARGRLLLQGKLLPRANPSAAILADAIERRLAVVPFEPNSAFTSYRLVLR